MSDHTPGPWRIVEGEGATFKGGTDRFWIVQGTDGQGAVASLFWHFNHVMPQAENEANARLIAAAPDLLEAARFWEKFAAYCVEHSITLPLWEAALFGGALDATHAAIAKATGEAAP